MLDFEWAQRISAWLGDVISKEFVIAIIGLILGAIVTGIFAVFRRLRDRSRLASGDASDEILFQVNYVKDNGNGPVLMLRNIAGDTQVDRLFRSNVAAQDLVKKLARGTTISDAQLQFQDKKGEQAFHGFVNHLISSNALSPFELKNILVTVTCEDRTHLKRVQIRMFLIEEEDLLKFLDPAFCASIKVEKPWQAVRVVALHQWAKQFEAQKTSRGQNAPVSLTRWVQLGIRQDFTPIRELEVNWTEGQSAEAMHAAGLDFCTPQTKTVAQSLAPAFQGRITQG